MLHPAKPRLDEVQAFLARHQALIVHCSGTPKGVGPGMEPYPNDLLRVWRGQAQGGISCSLVKPGDRFHGDCRNSTGSVGLVVAPVEPRSIVAVAPHDAGSFVVDGVRVVGQETGIGAANLEDSLTARGESYNEWVVRNFSIVGLFVAVPAETWQQVQMQMPEGMPPEVISQATELSVHQAARDFKELPIYSVNAREILRWAGQGWCVVAHSEIYRDVVAPSPN